MAEILTLLNQVRKPPEQGGPVGAGVAQLNALRDSMGFDLPRELQYWLVQCNGLIAGPGGLYGTGTGDDFLDIEAKYEFYPQWRTNKWIPIAGDGHGNTYVLDVGRQCIDADAVFFIDSMESVDTPAYIVASGVLSFLRFLLGREAGEVGWPFRREFVVARDAVVLTVIDSRLLPWSESSTS